MSEISLDEKIEVIQNLVKVQCTPGNYDLNPYMHGMVNGMILCLALLEERDPVFLEEPKRWLRAPQGREGSE